MATSLATGVPTYDTVTSAVAAGLTTGDTFVCGGRYMYLMPAAYSGASPLAVPWHYRTAQLKLALEGGTAVSSSPNDDYSWTVTTGVVSASGTETAFGVGAITEVTASWTEETSGDVGVYLQAYGVGTSTANAVTIEGRSEQITIVLTDGSSGDIDLTSGGTAGGLNDYVAGSTVHTELWLEHLDSQIELREYDSQVLINGHTAVTSSSDSAVTITATSGAAQHVVVKGSPALAVYQLPYITPWYATVASANAALSPSGGDECRIGASRKLCTYVDGDDFTAGGVSGASGIWIPQEYYASRSLLGAFKGGTAYDASPNSDYGFSQTGAISESGDETTVGDGTTAYADLQLLNTGTSAGDAIIQYMRAKVATTGTSDNAVSSLYYNGQYRLRWTYTCGGVEQDVGWDQRDESTSYDADTLVEVLAVYGSGSPGASGAILYDYQTMASISTASGLTADASPDDDWYMPCASGQVSTVVLSGWPAVAFWSA